MNEQIREVHINKDGGVVVVYHGGRSEDVTDKRGVVICRPDESAHARYAGSGAEHSDDRAVDNFAEAMKLKMERGREKGRSGWDDPLQCSGGDLARMLVQHIEKGDPVDIANFCMMIHQRCVAAHEIQSALNEYVIGALKGALKC